MTTVTTRVENSSDLRWRGRVGLALLLPIGPAAVAALRYLIPYDTTDSSTEVARKVAEHQGAENAAIWFGFIAMLTLVPAVLAVAKLARRESPKLAAIAVTLLVPAYIVIGWLVASDAAVLFSVRHGLSVEDAAASYDNLHPGMLVAGLVFVVGHVLGTVLLGCALWRGGDVPRWAAAIIAVSQPLHFVAAVIVASHELDLFAWGANAFGFGIVSLALLRMSDEEWASR